MVLNAELKSINSILTCESLVSRWVSCSVGAALGLARVMTRVDRRVGGYTVG